MVLVNGVDEMLKKGKTTCAALKAAIDGALTILIGDATKAKGNMTSSCDKVSQSVRERGSEGVSQSLRERGSEGVSEGGREGGREGGTEKVSQSVRRI